MSMDNWPRITLFGDSITRFSMNPDEGCWASMIAHQVASYYQVDVRGFTGYSSKWVVDMVPKLFTKEYLKNVEVFVMFIGHNDCWDPKMAPQATTCNVFEANMRSMLKHLTTHGLNSKDIIMLTPTWYDVEHWTRHRIEIGKPLVTKTLEDATNFALATQKVAKEFNVTCIDFFNISLKHKALSELFFDGIHLSKVGAKFLYNSLYPEIKKKIEERHKKSIEDIWMATPYEQRDDFKEFMKKAVEKLQQQQIHKQQQQKK